MTAEKAKKYQDLYEWCCTNNYANPLRCNACPIASGNNGTGESCTDFISNLGKREIINFAKDDGGKRKLSLVPTEVIYDIAEVREYGISAKYHDPDDWRQVEPERFFDAAYRHLLAMVGDMYAVDEESGIEHYKHLACNIAFLCALLRE